MHIYDSFFHHVHLIFYFPLAMGHKNGSRKKDLYIYYYIFRETIIFTIWDEITYQKYD